MNDAQKAKCGFLRFCRFLHALERGRVMLKNERHKLIVDRIREQQNVRVNDLKEWFRVSDETIRRDLLELEKQGLLRCVHGGAVYDSLTANEYEVEVRINNNPMEKEAICREAAKLVQDGQSLAILASTTTLPLGKYLAVKNHLTVVTNSIQIGNQISSNSSNRVILAGGSIWNKQQKTMGALTAQSFRQYRVDKAFFSVSGISRTDGLTEYTEEESEMLRAAIEMSRERILLNDSSKFDVVALCRFAGLEVLNWMITDWHITKKELAPYTELGIAVSCAGKTEKRG